MKFLIRSSSQSPDLSRTLLVCKGRKRWVKTFTELSNHLWFVEHIVKKERLRILVESNVNLSKGIAGSRFGTSSGYTSLKPWLQQTKTVSAISTNSSTGHAVPTAMRRRLIKSSFAPRSKSFPMKMQQHCNPKIMRLRGENFDGDASALKYQKN